MTEARTLKAVLFDLDDTLIDWSGFDHDWEKRERTLLRGVFDYTRAELHPLDDFEALLDAFMLRTRSAWEGARASLRAPNLGAVLAESLADLGVPTALINTQRVLESYPWGAIPGAVVFPDALEVLPLLHEHGVRTGIVTNAYQPMWLRDREIEHFGLLPHFPDCRISAADVGYLKPHPAIFEHALRLLDARPEEAVFVGDNPVADIAGAQAAGLQAVLRVVQPAPALLSGLIVPDHAINSLHELPDILDQWFPGWRS
jgi:FMN phosphatase YigB (HAD superfamily)